MASIKHCCVPGCIGSGRTHTVLHGFPNPVKHRERFNTWLYAIGGDILSMDNDRIFQYRRVCRSHFEDKYLCRNDRISSNAVPTLNMPGPFSRHIVVSSQERQPLQEIVNILQPSTSSDPRFLWQQSANIQDVETENMRPFSRNTVVSSQERQPLQKIGNIQQPSTSSGDSGKLRIRHKKRLFSKAEETLYKKLISARVKISKLRNRAKKQALNIKLAKKLAMNPDTLKVLENSSSSAKLLLQMQCRENAKKVKGRRFSLEEKILSLSMYKQSPKGYRFLRKIFILPAQQTLIKLIHKSNIKPGINHNIFSQLKRKAALMKPAEKLCTLLFDEMSLKPNLTYNERKEMVVGFMDNGHERKQDFADHVQVFMVRGLVHNYKQPIAYTFSSSATKGSELAVQIKEIVKEMQAAGLIVVALVCDQGTNNRHAIKLLLNETRGVYLKNCQEPKTHLILINEMEIIPLYDPPHLLKGIRNNLLNKNLQYTIKGESKIAKWSHLELMYENCPGYKGLRLMPKLTENHVNPEKINKMKVKLASQIFSYTVGTNLGFLAESGILPAECTDTADLLLFMDNIFDSVNGSHEKNKYAKPLLGPATPHSIHHKTWEEAIKIFESMLFIAPSGKAESVPTVENWVWTLKGIKILLRKLEINYGITSVWLRHLNQDPLENFFGAVRSHGCRNNNPTCEQFESTFATLLINNINSVHTRGNNCEGDFCKALQSIIINQTEEPTSTCIFDFSMIIHFNFTPLVNKQQDPRIIGVLQYVSGYFLKKAKFNVFKSCNTCKKDLESTDELQYIQRREYAGRRWLCTPSNELILLISNIQDIINYLIKENIEKKNLTQIFKTVILTICDFKFITCSVHREKIIDYVITISVRCLIFSHCKNINMILAGRRQVDDDEDCLQMKAKKLNKCFKRRK